MQPSYKPFEETHEPLDNRLFSRRDWLRQAGLVAGLPLISPLAWATDEPDPVQAVVLAYNRFAKKSGNKQTLSENTFKDHIKAIQDSGATVIKLADLVLHKNGLLAKLPPKAVVLTINGADRSAMETVMRLMASLLWPITMFIEPSKVGTSKSMLTWDELIALHHGDRFSMQSTSHALTDLVKEHKGRSTEDFERVFKEHIGKGKTVVETRLVKPVSFVSWPYGAYDDDMLAFAKRAGFLGGVALGNRPCKRSDPVFAVPRYEMSDDIKGADLTKIIAEAWPDVATQPQS
jgi:peptidoglycan/xylan/chitin deacetylase (PgdA/CDA1 family)